MKVLNTVLMCIALSGCLGHRVSGKVEHKVTTEGTTEVVIRIDISGCMVLETDEAKLECIRAVLETFKEVNESAKTIACVQSNTNEPAKCFEGDAEEIIENAIALTNN